MSVTDFSLQPRTTPRHESIRVMIVDDAVVVRGLLVRWIEAEAGLQVVASLRSGREAIEQVERTRPDVVILDVDMPDIDGITALPRLFEKRHDLVVIMSSTLTRRNAEISLRALSLGAADYIPKPETTGEIASSPSFRRDLIEKIRALGTLRRQRLSNARPLPWAMPAGRLGPSPATSLDLGRGLSPERKQDLAPESHLVAFPGSGQAPTHASSPVPWDGGGLSRVVPPAIKLRPLPPIPPRVLVVGASTGGPQALMAIAPHIAEIIDQVPVLITQHMPPTFTTILAEHLARVCGRPVHEATEGESIRAGRVYLAPGGRHMRVGRRDGMASVCLDDGPPINFCKPAVDPLFSSAAATWGSSNLALVLTGMGADGSRGAADIVAAGGCVIAQDEESSVVWGMPGTVARAGLCSIVLPIEQIAAQLVHLFFGSRS